MPRTCCVGFCALAALLAACALPCPGNEFLELGFDPGGIEAARLLPTYSRPQAAAPHATPASVLLCNDAVDNWFNASACASELAECVPKCDECPRSGYYAMVGYDTWRGVTDGNWQNNGIHAGANYGTRLGRLSDLTGIGFQLGATIGAYNWAGTDYRLSNQGQAEPQGFVTGGFFRHATETCPWSAAVVSDWMLNSNYGVFSQNPTLGQWRGYAGYVLNPANEIGIWGTWRARGDSRDVPGFGTVRWRSVNQLNAFWHYKWAPGQTDSWIWVGRPENDRLAGGGSLGDWIVGLLANVPFSDRVGLYALVTYMHQSAAAGIPGAREDAWNFTTGLAIYPRRNARNYTVAGQSWMPLLPVANNGYFLVDTNQNF